MKKLALGAAALAAATSVVLVPSAAEAGGGTGGSSVSINQYADFNFNGTQLDLGLQVSCTGATGVVNVSVDQPYPDSPDPLGAHGTGVMDVVCDGRTHSVGVTVVGVVYDAGKATVTATLTAPSGTKTVSRQVVVKVV
ncbi:MAG: hypothetical protein ACJ73E_13970 [Mycobacteriales bacterium]